MPAKNTSPRRATPAPQAKAAAAPVRSARGKTLKATRGRQAGMPILNQFILTGFCLVLFVIGLPTALMLTIALLPTFCAFLVAHSQGYYSAISIGALNIAGTWPFLLKLWKTGHTASNAITIILDPTAWLIIYGAATAGWVLCMWFPILVSSFMSMFSAHRLKELKRQQNQLVEEWGPEVAKNKTASDL